MSASGRPHLLVIVGPTAAGKTEQALGLCEAVGGEVVSVDSVQVYRGLDVGSAKPTRAEQARVPHHVIDCLEPTDPMDAAQWAARADAAIADIAGRGRAPVVCGGTGLYVRALLHGLLDLPEVDLKVREAVREELETAGAEALHAQLATVDPESAAGIPAGDRQRVSRALEVYRQTGRPLSAFQREHGFREQRYPATVVGLWPAREVLERRITARAAAMVRSGLVEEVEGLLAAGVPSDAPGLRTLGYRSVVDVLEGRADRADLPQRVALGHRRYAKRQLTWFRGVSTREDGLVHLDPQDGDTPGRLVTWARGDRPS